MEAVRYEYRTHWSDEDNCFIGTVSEFPSLSAHGSTSEMALTEIHKVVEFVIQDLVESGEEIPQPRSCGAAE